MQGKGWHDARITARKPITLDPAAAVLHYAQEIFEGLKAYRLVDGSMAMFRADANARRFNQSAARLAMPQIPEETFLDSVRQLVRIDKDWFPSVEGGSLYIRPFMFASEVFLGVKPSAEYLYIVILSPVGAYFKSGAQAVSLWVSQHYTRAAPGGTAMAMSSPPPRPVRWSVAMSWCWIPVRSGTAISATLTVTLPSVGPAMMSAVPMPPFLLRPKMRWPHCARVCGLATRIAS